VDAALIQAVAQAAVVDFTSSLSRVLPLDYRLPQLRAEDSRRCHGAARMGRRPRTADGG
jgi:hypothetical protein